MFQFIKIGPCVHNKMNVFNFRMYKRAGTLKIIGLTPQNNKDCPCGFTS